MCYKFVNEGDKQALLKRCYRQFQIVVVTFIVVLIVFILIFPACAHAHGVPVVLAFSGLGIGSALYLRSRHKRYEIDPAELASYIWRQPMMMVVWVIMAISVLVHLFQTFFHK